MSKNLRLKELLDEKGLSGKELAEKIEVTENTISFIKNGKRNPSFEILVKIANALNVNIGDLFIKTKKRFS